MGQALRDVLDASVVLKGVFDLLQNPTNRGDEITDPMVAKFIVKFDGSSKELRQAVDDLGFALQLKRHDQMLVAHAAEAPPEPTGDGDPNDPGM